MVLQRYIDILARRKWVVLLVTVVTVAIAAIGSRLQQPIYTSAVTMRVAQASTGSTDYAEYYYAERLLKTYAEIVKSGPFLIDTINRLNLTVTPEDLLKRVKVEVVLDTELIKITVEDPQPGGAAATANMLASLLLERSQDLLFGGAKSARAILEEQLTVAEDNLQRDHGALQTLLSQPAGNKDRIEALTTKAQLDQEIYANLLRQYEEARISEVSRANSVTITEPATEPKKPTKPRLILNLTLGVLLGFCAGLGLAFLVETLDASLHSVGDLEAIVRPAVLGVLPLASLGWRKRQRPLLFTLESDRTGAEAYRLLRARIFSATQDGLPKTVLVTSPEAGAGKSTVTANLAVVLADAGQHVIVVDADLRRSSLHRFFGLSNERGLSDVLLGTATLNETLQTTSDLQVLTTGPLPPNPSELLGSARMTAVIKELASRADRVLVDCPPLLAVADGTVLAPQVDRVLLVTARGETTSKRVETACQLLEKIGARVLGVVFNKARGDERYYYYRYPAPPKRSRGIARVVPAVAVIGLVLAALVGVGWFLAPPWMQTIPWLGPLIAHSAPARAAVVAAPPSITPTVMPGGTSEPAVGSEPATAPTRTPLLPRPAFISSATQGLTDGVFVYDDPITVVPGNVWLPAGSPIEVLEVDIYGRVYYGTRRWFLIRCVSDGRTHVGYVPATLVAWTP